MTIDPASRLGRWFVWSCDHLPAVSTRSSEDHLERGVSLCFVFWATLWGPLLNLMFVAVAVTLFVLFHVVTYDHGQTELGGFGFLWPEVVLLGVLVTLALLVGLTAAFLGLDRLTGAYLRGLKKRVCPLVTFKER